MKLKKILLFLALSNICVLKANMASPIFPGTKSASAFSSKDIDIVSESIKYTIDKDFDNALVEVEYNIFCDNPGQQIPLLFHALDYRDSFKVWLDGKQVNLIDLNTVDTFNPNHDLFRQYLKNSSKDEIIINWSNDYSDVYKLRDLKYFSIRLEKGPHKVKVEYMASAWIEMTNWFESKCFRYSLSPAKMWRSFGGLTITVEQSGITRNYVTNLSAPIEKQIQSTNTWYLKKLPGEFIEIKYTPPTPSFALGLIKIGPIGLTAIFSLLIAMAHFYLIYKLQGRKIRYQKILLIDLASPLIAALIFIFYLFSFDIIDFFIGDHASHRHGFPFQNLIFSPLIALAYWFIVSRISKLSKLSLSLLILPLLIFESCNSPSQKKTGQVQSPKVETLPIHILKDTMPEYGSQAYRKLAIAFTRQIIHTIDSTKIPVLSEETASRLLNQKSKLEFLTDSQIFSKDEIISLRTYLETKAPLWKKSEFKGLKFVSNEQLTSIHKNEDYKFFYTYQIHVISYPIFIRNGKYCICSVISDCGAWCSYGTIGLYEYKKGVWIKVKTYVEMVS